MADEFIKPARRQHKHLAHIQRIRVLHIGFVGLIQFLPEILVVINADHEYKSKLVEYSEVDTTHKYNMIKGPYDIIKYYYIAGIKNSYMVNIKPNIYVINKTIEIFNNPLRFNSLFPKYTIYFVEKYLHPNTSNDKVDNGKSMSLSTFQQIIDSLRTSNIQNSDGDHYAEAIINIHGYSYPVLTFSHPDSRNTSEDEVLQLKENLEDAYRDYIICITSDFPNYLVLKNIADATYELGNMNRL